MIKFGMKLPEIFNQLVRGYQKVRGQKPTGLDLIKIKQEAMQKFQDMRKVLDMQGKALDTSKPIIGGTQQGNAIKSGIMKATGAGPEVVEGINPKFIDFTINSFKNMDGIKVMKEGNKVIKREGPYKDLTKNDAKRILDAVDDKMKNIDMDPEDMYADGGRIGLVGGGITNLALRLARGFMKVTGRKPNKDEMQKIIREAAEKDLDDAISSAKTPGLMSKDEFAMNVGSGSRAIGRRMDTVDRSQFSKMIDEFNFAQGGRAGFKDGEGIMQMASNDMNERLLEKIFEDLLEQGMDPKDAEIKAREIFNQMGDMSSMPDRGAQSIKLADGGITRVGLKDGLSKKLNKKFTIDGGTLRSMFFNKNNPILTGFNASELFDLAVRNIGPAIGLADGGRAAFKDGPKDPRRRGFMKAAVGVASMLPFGMGKIVKTAAPAIEKAADISGPALAKIVETVMSLGKTISQSGKRVKEMITKKKHKGVEVEEDIMDGSYTIKKGSKEIYFKPGRRDEMGIDDDIIEVIEKTVTKKADGGVARLLGE